MFYEMSTDFQKYFIFLTERNRISMNIFNINVPKDEISMIFDPYGDIENYSTSLYLHKSKIALDDDKYKLFNILIEQTDDAIEIYDMRQLGGGLSEDEPDNFELLDIGHINGRPYRVAGALVLTMPTKYSSHD